ncbi:MAG: LytTR family transcriptional regulator DNA-binding domain-containing protein [Holophagaceae bacterium]|nr:LytTR family transcriptional regulator DNA-binding domain-containing protein [Holophagaceae bacterium]
MSKDTFTALIVDDEELARALVREHLEPHPEIRILAECANGFEAVKAATEQKPDLLFLDIQMPKLDGFEVLELLETQPATVFITAFDQHAIKAFEAHAVDYLLKPFSEARFEEALAKAKAKCVAGQPSVPRPAELSASARDKWPLERLVVRDGSKVTFISLDKLDYVQAQDDYVELKTEGRSYLKQQTLSSLENQLDPNRFLRVHRSFLLPLDRLARLEQGLTDSWTAILRDGTKLPVSRSGYAKLKELIG